MPGSPDLGPPVEEHKAFVPFFWYFLLSYFYSNAISSEKLSLIAPSSVLPLNSVYVPLCPPNVLLACGALLHYGPLSAVDGW